MPRKPSSTPTEVELAILQVLWRLGSATVRQIHEALRSQRRTGPSTTLKMVQVMTDKGLLLRDETQRPQVYRAARSQEQTQLELVDDLIQRGFGGSAQKLVLSAAAAHRITPEELSQIKRLIEKAKEGQ